MTNKTCWSCGHYLIGGMCFKKGDGSYQNVKNDYLCSDWKPENAEGTITLEISKHVEEDWAKDGVNYWENPDCPRGHLERSLVQLISVVEGITVSLDYFKNHSEDALRQEITFYEHVMDK